MNLLGLWLMLCLVHHIYREIVSTVHAGSSFSVDEVYVLSCVVISHIREPSEFLCHAFFSINCHVGQVSIDLTKAFVIWIKLVSILDESFYKLLFDAPLLARRPISV